jgi:signal transduction histidine kinase
MDAPAQLDFAQQVRAERLSALWKITIALAIFAAWGVLILMAVKVSTDLLTAIIPVIAVFVGCFATRQFLRTDRYDAAVWSYTIGLLVALGVLLRMPTPDGSTVTSVALIPFAFPIVILLVGLLLPVRATFIVAALSIAITFIVPVLGQAFVVTSAQLFAIALMLVATGIAAQMAGEVYGIAEWALESYRKERKMKDDLFDAQQEIQRSFMRQKALTEQVQETNTELERARASALEAKNFRGQFLANMSHELRTPLNAIIGFSETMLNFPMMYDNTPLPPAYKTDLGQIYTSGKHLLQLINDILDLSKVDAGKLDLEIEQVDLEPIFKGVLATAVGLVGDKPIKLKRETTDKFPLVMGDSLRIRQVILNLISNAAKFTDEGSITLGANPEQNGEITIWVRDSGIGIPPQELDNIFEEFKQGSSGRRKGRAGSGLGLAITRQLLGLMNGRIWVESTVGKGSTFFFTLPVYVPEPVQQQG